MNTASMNICLFASGSGSNAEAILSAIEEGRLTARAGLIVTDRPEAPVLQRVQRFNVPAKVMNPSEYASPADYTEALLALLGQYDITFIALAGYLRKIPARLVELYKGRMVNIHPALLPSFGGPGMYGLHVHRAVLEKGVRWTGATVHFVDLDYDTGPIILQKPVPVFMDDTPEKLASRVLEVEHRLYPEALRLFAEGRVRLENDRVYIDPMIPRH